MNKPFLLIASDRHCPAFGTGDWLGCYETEEEAWAQIRKVPLGESENPGTKIVYFGKDPNVCYDWVEVVDLRTWACD